MKIESVARRNRTVSVSGVNVVFDENGVADVDDAIGAKLLKLGGYRSPQSAAKGKPEQSQKSGPGLEAMNTAQLKKLAKERGIEVGDASKKSDLIELIEKAAAGAQG